MSATAAEFKTAEMIRAQAEAEYEQTYPHPEPPEPLTLARPGVVQIGENAHLWIDVITEPAGYSRRTQAHAQLFIVERDHGKDQRIQGNLTPEYIDALIQELKRVREDVAAKQQFLRRNLEYEQQQTEWEKARSEFARQHVAEWERLQGGKKR